MIKNSTFYKIWSLLDISQKRSATILLVLMFMGMGLEMLGVTLVIPAIVFLTDPVLLNDYEGFKFVIEMLGNPSQKTLIIGAMLGLVFVYLFKSMFLAYLAWHQSKFAFDIQAQFSKRLFSMYINKPYTFHLQRNSAQLIRTAVTDINLFIFHGLIPALTLLTEGMVLLGLGILLFIFEPLGTLAVICVLGTAAWIFYYFTQHLLVRLGEEYQYNEGLRIQHLQQGLGGVKDVKILGREKDFLNRYSVHNIKSARAGQLRLTLQQLPRFLLEFLAVVGLATLVIIMMYQSSQLSSIIPILGLFGAAAFRLMPSINRVLGSMQSMRFGLAVINNLYSELQNEAISSKSDDRVLNSQFKQSLFVEHVGFTYPESDRRALEDISLKINKSEIVGFVGTSGAGKSTLVDILLGLLTPDEGKVFLDGNDIQVSLRNWQNQIGYVPQSIFLTDDTLRNNIAFGLHVDEVDESAVWRAISAAQLEVFVNQLPDGLNTVVGERGVRLSGGQRQRIGIARALYHDPEVLVLDEATSSLDTATENEVMKAVYDMQGSKTIIIIAHRLSTVEHCDRLYQLENGRIVLQNESNR